MHIESDRDSPFGVVWSGDPADQPTKAGLVPRLGIEVDPLAPVYPGGPRAGFFAENGYWIRCGTIDTDRLASRGDQVDLAAQDVGRVIQAGTTEFIPVGGAVNLAVLRDSALAQSEPPQPARTGRTPLDGGQTIVKLPTWFWVEDDYWRDYVGTQTSPGGRLQVTVTASPVHTTWNTGEHTIVCDQGMEYLRNMAPHLSNCSVEYQHSTTITAAGYHQVEGTVLFETTWQLDFDGAVGYDLGRLADQTSTDTYQLKVGEIQALIINPDRPGLGCVGCGGEPQPEPVHECFHCDGTIEVIDF